MMNVAEFIEIRQRIELLAQQITVSNERKAVAESTHRLDEAVQLLATLTAMAENDVQDIAVGRLTRQLSTLGIKVGALTAKKRVVKKQPAAGKPA